MEFAFCLAVYKERRSGGEQVFVIQTPTEISEISF